MMEHVFIVYEVFRWFPWRYLCFMGNVIQACDNEVLGGSWWLRPIGSLWWAWPLGAKDGSQCFEKMVIIKSYNLVMATSTSPLPYKEGRGQTSNPLFHYECRGKDHKILFGGLGNCNHVLWVHWLNQPSFAKNIFMQNGFVSSQYVLSGYLTMPWRRSWSFRLALWPRERRPAEVLGAARWTREALRRRRGSWHCIVVGDALVLWKQVETPKGGLLRFECTSWFMKDVYRFEIFRVTWFGELSWHGFTALKKRMTSCWESVGPNRIGLDKPSAASIQIQVTALPSPPFLAFYSKILGIGRRWSSSTDYSNDSM